MNLPTLPKRPTRITLARILERLSMKHWSNGTYFASKSETTYTCAYGAATLALHPDFRSYGDFPVDFMEEVQRKFNLEERVPSLTYPDHTVTLGDKMETANDYGYRAAAYVLRHPNATRADLIEQGFRNLRDVDPIP